MINFLTDETYFNQFINLDSIDIRIIHYLRDSTDCQAEKLWKLLKHSDMKALYQNNLTQKEKDSMIYKDSDEKNKRIFTFSLIEDSFEETCSILKIYIHSIEPKNHLTAVVNVAVDILTHNKISNVYNDDGDSLEGGRPVEAKISFKNRNNVLLKAILHLLNGADIEGVGKLQFNQELTVKSKMENRINNTHNFYGYNIVFSCIMSGVGEAQNG